jgi:hypothetical protein
MEARVEATVEAASKTFVAENRIVFTYEVEDRDIGILTGYENDSGFFLEHVIAFPGNGPAALPALLAAGLDEAGKRGYRYIALFIEHGHPLREKLESLAKRFGFCLYADLVDRAHYVLYAPSR